MKVDLLCKRNEEEEMEINKFHWYNEKFEDLLRVWHWRVFIPIIVFCFGYEVTSIRLMTD